MPALPAVSARATRLPVLTYRSRRSHTPTTTVTWYAHLSRSLLTRSCVAAQPSATPLHDASHANKQLPELQASKQASARQRTRSTTVSQTNGRRRRKTVLLHRHVFYKKTVPRFSAPASRAFRESVNSYVCFSNRAGGVFEVGAAAWQPTLDHKHSSSRNFYKMVK